MLFQIWNLNFISVYEMFIVGEEETMGGERFVIYHTVAGRIVYVCVSDKYLQEFHFKPYNLLVN